MIEVGNALQNILKKKILKNTDIDTIVKLNVLWKDIMGRFAHYTHIISLEKGCLTVGVLHISLFQELKMIQYIFLASINDALKEKKIINIVFKYMTLPTKDNNINKPNKMHLTRPLQHNEKLINYVDYMLVNVKDVYWKNLLKELYFRCVVK